ncbi:SAM-dependent methyltransferase [Actinoplanes sp. RD1]|uniref:SAM-dependent methyltransferase n=1 Tax=Actinoplanes sp. RD1 TaxID=3064538 RepID=UPI002740F6FD|nr:methyltransferase domain-containing protein [Actinoplanes sp. RD1]
MELDRSFVIRERDHRIHDPFTPEKFAVLGEAIRLRPGMTVLDLACGSGEMLYQWSRDHGVTGTGVDISTPFLTAARRRAPELSFVHADASTYVADTPVDVAACIGATWIGGGVEGTVALLERSLRPGGLLLIGEPFWRSQPPAEAPQLGEFEDLPGLVALFGRIGWDLVEMVLADEDSWDRYVAAQWMTVRTWLDENPHDELAPQFRAELDTAPLDYVRYQRPYLGWGVFALKRR